MSARHSLQQGFTLIEMLVIAPIVVLAIGAFLTVIISMTGEVLSSRASNTLTYDVQDALNRIEADIKLSTTFLAANNITLTAGEAQGYNNDATDFTNVAGASGTSLILNQLVTTGNPLSIGSSLVYLADKPNACASASIKDNTPMTMNVVYFVKNDPNNGNIPTLWRRTVMPSNYANPSVRCAEPWQQPSCAPGYTASFCKTNDIKLVSGVAATNFSVQYFTSANATIADTTASDGGALVAARNTALASATTASISISASQNVAGRSVERSASLRATRLDTNASTIASPTSVTAPGTPGAVTAAFNGAGSVIVNWSPTSTSYNLQYDTTGTFTAPNTFNNIAGASKTITGLMDSPVYYFRVQATNSAGTSSWSSTISVGSACPTNFIVVPGNGLFNTSAFCAMKYEAKQASSTVPISQAAGAPWVNISQVNAAAYSANVAGCTGCHLMTENEWLTLAHNVLSQNSNWTGGTVGSGTLYIGHGDGTPGSGIAASTSDSDNYINTGQSSGNQRRTSTLSNGQVIWDLIGNVWEWTTGSISSGQPPTTSGWAWRQWSAVTNAGSLPASAFPSYGTPAAASWGSAQYLGQFYSNSADTGTPRWFERGGAWGDGANAGLFALSLFVAASDSSNASIGFRVAR